IPYRDVEISRCVYARPRSSPDSSLAWRWDSVNEQRSLTVGTGSDDAANIIGTVAIKTTKGNIDHSVREGESRALLMCWWVHTIGINQATHFHLAVIGIQSNQDMRGSANLCNGEHQACCRVIYWCACDA